MLVIYNGVKHSNLLKVPGCSAQSRGNTRNNKDIKLGTTGNVRLPEVGSQKPYEYMTKFQEPNGCITTQTEFSKNGLVDRVEKKQDCN